MATQTTDNRTLITYTPSDPSGSIEVPHEVALRLVARLATRAIQIEGRCSLADGGRLVDGIAAVDGHTLPSDRPSILLHAGYTRDWTGPWLPPELGDHDWPPSIIPGRVLLTSEGDVAREYAETSAYLSWRAASTSQRWVEAHFHGGRDSEGRRMVTLRWSTPEPSRFLGALLASEGLQ